MRAWVVDAFADEEYAGNDAAVIVRESDFPATETMLGVAARLGLPTTAFVVPEEPSHYRIRWFTPRKELNICGHATIASACYLYEIAGVPEGTRLCFHSSGGTLYTARSAGRIAIDLPRMDVVASPAPSGLEDALGTRIVHCARAVDDIIVEVESEAALMALEPDFAALAGIDCRGHIATACAGSVRGDFVLRSYFPALGVDEDQVCVSAHCKLGPYWAARLGRQRLEAVQLSPRGGRLVVEVEDDRVHVIGQANVRCAVPV